jgi:hypothetical protein
VLDRLARISAEVVPDVPLGFHRCYGDFGHRHWKEPEDTIPAVRGDAGYSAPLRKLRLRPEPDPYPGLVYAGDALGTARRAAAARTAVARFGVATECGMGRTPRELIEGLLALNAEAADPVGGALPAAIA